MTTLADPVPGGRPEFFHLGALLSLPDAPRIARWAGRHNARRVYRFPDDSPGDG
jgi:hypothetical protein